MALKNLGPKGEVRKFIRENFEGIIRDIDNEDGIIVNRGINISEFMGERSSALARLFVSELKYDVRDNGASKKDRVRKVFAKYFLERKPSLPEGLFDSKEEYWQVENEAYCLCSGFQFMPKFFGGRRDRTLVFEYVPGKTLEEVLNQTENYFQRKEYLERVLTGVVPQLHEGLANQMSRVISGNLNGYDLLLRHFKDSSNVIKKAGGYLRAIEGLKSVTELPLEMREDFAHAYWPIHRAYHQTTPRFQIGHGDLNASNIIIRETDEVPILVDPKIKYRHPLIDVADLLSSPGVRLSPMDLEDLARKYLESKRDTYQTQHKYKLVEKSLRALFSVVGNPSVVPEAEKKEMGVFYRAMIHESFRKMAKARDIEKNFPGIYNLWIRKRPAFRSIYPEMRSNIQNALDRLLSKPEEFDVKGEDERGENELRHFSDLKSLFFTKGFIEPEDYSPGRGSVSRYKPIREEQKTMGEPLSK